MADEVVGSAYVVIRAITERVRDDIRRGVQQGARGNRRASEQAGQQIGSDIGEAAGDEAGRATSEGIQGRLRDDRGRFRRSGETVGDDIAEGADNSRGLRRFGQRFRDRLRKQLDGKGAGRNFGKSILDGMQGAFDAIPTFKLALLPALVPALATLLPVIASYVSSIVSLLGSIGPALVGGAVAGTAAYLSLGLAIGAVALALKSTGPEATKFKKQMKGIGEQFGEVGDKLAKILLPRLGDNLERMTNALLPLLSTALQSVAEVLADLSGRFANMAESSVFQDSFSRALGNSVYLLDKLGIGFRRLTEAFFIVLGAARPVIEVFGNFIDRISKAAVEGARLNKVVGGDGGLRSFFLKAADAMRVWGAIIGNVTAGIFDIIGVAAPFGDKMAKNIRKSTAAFREFTSSEEGQKKIKDFFQDMQPILRQANKLFVAVFKGIGSAIANPEIQKNTVNLLKVLRKDLLPALGDLFEKLIPLGPKFTELVKAIAKFISNVANSKGFDVFIENTGKIYDAISNLLSSDIAGKIAGFALAFAGIAGAANLILKPLGGLAGVIGKVLGPLGRMFQTFRFFYALSAIGGSGPIGAIGSGIAAVLGPIGLIIAAIAAIVIVMVVLYKKNERFRDLVQKAWGQIKEAFAAVQTFISEELAPAFFELVDTVKSAFDQLSNGTGGALGNIREVIKIFIDAIVSIFEIGWGLISGVVEGVWKIMKGVILGAIKVIQGVIKVVMGLISGDWGMVWDGIKDIVSGVWTAIKGIVSGAAKVLLSVLDAAWELLKLGVKLTFEVTKELVKGGVNAIIDLVKGIPGKLKDLGGIMKDAGKALIGALFKGLGASASFVGSFAKDVGNAIINTINSLIDDLNSLLVFDFKVKGVGISVDAPDIGHIPGLATGGRVTAGRGTLAVIGEGKEAETVLPDSLLRGLLERTNETGRQQGAADAAAPRGGISVRIDKVEAHDYKDFMTKMQDRTKQLALGGFDLPEDDGSDWKMN